MKLKHRLHHAQIPSEGSIVELAPEEANHAKVLRLKEGDLIELFDGKSCKALAKIVGINKRSVEVQILERTESIDPEPVRITLIQGLPRSDRFDLILQKATELGVSTILPAFTEYSQVKLKPERFERKLYHWQRIVIEASRQCGRVRVPQVSAPLDYDTALNEASDRPLRLVLSPDAPASLSEVLAPLLQSPPESIAFVIGPEGGLSEAEVLKAEKKGFIRVNLGWRILRTETAPIVMLTVLQYLFGDLGR